MTVPQTITSEIQKLEPSAIVELFELDATAIGGEVLRFHAGTNGLRQNVVWQGNTYTAFPMQATGFDYTGNGQLPRPKMIMSNASGAMTLLVLSFDDMLGTKVTRRRTLAKYLDAVNFPARRNLLLNSGDLSSVFYGNGVRTANQLIAPDGTLTASTVSGNGTGFAVWRQTANATATSMTFTCFVKIGVPSTRTSFPFLMRNDTTVTNFTIGTFSTVTGVITGAGWTSTSVGNDWFRISYTNSGTEIITAGNQLGLYFGALGGFIYDTSDVIGIWGAQLEAGSTATEYQPIGATWSQNPTADPAAEFPVDIFYIDRKASETRDAVEFELSSSFDVAGVQLPRRQIIQNVCTWRYRGAECGWTTPAPRVNRLLQSNAFNQSPWVLQNSVAITANFATDPFGGNTASRVVFPTGGLPRFYQDITTLGGQTVTLSVYAKSNTGTDQNVGIFIRQSSFGTVYASLIATVTTTWQRFSITAAIPVGVSFSALFYQSNSVTPTNDVLMYGAQVEIGSTATSYQDIGASYTEPTYFDANDAAVGTLAQDVCGKRLSSCKTRFGTNNPLPFGSFPAAGLTR
jgi:phage-related protein